MDYLAFTEPKSDPKGSLRLALSFPDCPGLSTELTSEAEVPRIGQRELVAWLEATLLSGHVPARPRRKARLSGQQKLHRVRVPLQLWLKLSLRWSRQDLNLSQAELATRLGVRQPQVARLERPGTNVSLATLERAFDAMGSRLSVEVQRLSAPSLK